MLPHLDGAVGLTVEPVPGWQRTYLCLDPLQVEAGSERQDATIDLAAPSVLIEGLTGTLLDLWVEDSCSGRQSAAKGSVGA
jgi:hypothetical protein